MFRVVQEFVNGTGNTLKELGAYLTGRGIMMSAGLAIWALGGAVSTPAVLGILGLGLVISVTQRLRHMRGNLDRMANIYRDDIADQLGIAPEQVTRTHVHALAYGEGGRDPNPVLREEIDHEWSKFWTGLATSLVSAAVGFSLVGFGWNNQSLVHDLPFGDSVPSWLLGTGAGLVTGLASLIINNGLDVVLTNTTSLGKHTLHDRIAHLDRSIVRGRGVTPEQVFSIYVAADSELGAGIAQRFGKPYDQLSAARKSQAIEFYGATADMTRIASDLNAKNITAGTLAFILTGQRSAPAQALAETADNAEPQRTNFVEKLGERPRETASFAEREDLRNATRTTEAAR